MNRKEKILSYIQSKNYIPLKFDELAVVIDVPEGDRGELSDILAELCNEGKIYITKKGRCAPVDERSATAAGKLNCSLKGDFGFVLCDDEDIFVAASDMMNALNGDKVLVKLENTNGHKRQGKVIRVLERGNDTVVGVIIGEKKGYLKLRPDNRRIYAKILIKTEDGIEALIGERVAVKIIKYGDDGRIYGEIIEVLGSKEELKSLVEAIILEHKITQEFTPETLLEADSVPEEITETDDREDLRDMLVFTIDGDDARDFDDAVSLTVSDNGNCCLGVHIADVSEYVKPNSALDREAYERGTSVYLADRVIPMLPEKLSNGICSLNPDEDRLALSLFMEITDSGDVVNHRLVRSVIRSKERMTYNNVNLILENNDACMCEKYSHLLSVLRQMEKLARTLREKRFKRGAINFNFSESHIKVDENGEPIEIEKEMRGTSNQMIEEFMLIANETAAEYAFWSEIPFVYRNHEAPSEEKIKTLNSFLFNFGLMLKGRVDKNNPTHPKALQQVLEKIKDTSAEKIISKFMLQSLMKAKYSSECTGHFGLASKYYCHFTSPIRRYPDLLVHRILKLALDNKLTGDTLNALNGYTVLAAEQSSKCEINAEYAERDTDDLMKAAFMRRFIGEVFAGTVSGVTRFGMFVELDNTVEGLVRVENMTSDYFEFDENSSSLIGRRTKRIYSVGDTVKVVLINSDTLLRQIDFVLEGDYKVNLLKSKRELVRKVRAGSNNTKLKNIKKRKRRHNG